MLWVDFSLEYTHKSKNGKVFNWVGISDYGDILKEIKRKRAGDLEYIINGYKRIDQVAQEVYGDYNLWWIIALRNDIEFPIGELWNGRKLEIPSPSWVLSRFS